MKRIKVLHITQSTIGGTLEYLKLFFSNINKDKFEVELICPSYGPMKSEIESLGFKVYTVNMKREITLINDLKCCCQLSKLIKKINPDIVHCHSSKAGVLGRIAAHKNKIPCIYNAHGWSFSMEVSNNKKKLYALIEKFFSRYCDVIVNISENEQKLALKYCIADKNKMQVIYNGIDVEKYKKNFNRIDILKELNIPKDSFIVGAVGRLSLQKSPDTFLQIAQQICKKNQKIYFIWVGDGELRKEFEESIKKMHLEDKIKITGWTNEVEKYISVFDVGILTSKWEGFGLVIAEYMASGKPVIASYVGGIPNIIKNNKNGILKEKNDVVGFIESILRIKDDSDFVFQIVENGYKDVYEKFNIKRVLCEHEKLYIKLLQYK